MVKVLPDPVTPSNVSNWLPSLKPLLEVSIGDFLDCFLYDGKNGGITVNSAESSFKCLWFPLCSYNDKYVCFLAGDDSYKSLVADGFERAEPVVEEHLVNGGGVLVLYTMGTIHN